MFALADRIGALFAARDDQCRDFGRQCSNAGVEIVQPGQRGQFMFVGKQDIDVAGIDQRAEIIAMTRDDKRIGQRERNLAPRGARGGNRPAHRAARLFRVPQIPFEIQHLRVGDHAVIKRLGRQKLRRAQERVHCALAVGRHENQATRSRWLAGTHRRVERDPAGADIMGKRRAQGIVGHLADKAARRAQRCQPRQSIRRRSARNLARSTHARIQRLRLRLVDQGHAALGHAERDDLVFAGRRHHIDNRIADRDDIETG